MFCRCGSNEALLGETPLAWHVTRDLVKFSWNFVFARWLTHSSPSTASLSCHNFFQTLILLYITAWDSWICQWQRENRSKTWIITNEECQLPKTRDDQNLTTTRHWLHKPFSIESRSRGTSMGIVSVSYCSSNLPWRTVTDSMSNHIFLCGYLKSHCWLGFSYFSKFDRECEFQWDPFNEPKSSSYSCWLTIKPEPEWRFRFGVRMNTNILNWTFQVHSC